MTRKVLIRIIGIQTMGEGCDHVEILTGGDYFLKDGKHYIVYDEVMDGFEGNVHNLVKVSPGILDIRKQGIIDTHMIFRPDEKNKTRYATPLGEMIVEITTKRLQIEEQEHSLKISVDYSLDINYDHVSDCNITLDVCSKEQGN